MRLLVTRPEPDAVRLCRKLKLLGHEAIQAPLLSIRPVAVQLPSLEGVQAILFTSANGVRHGLPYLQEASLPVLTVGARTAEAAKAAGFLDTISADGDARALAGLVKTRFAPCGGALLHLSGKVVTDDLARELEAAGYELRRLVVYEAVAASSLPPELVAALTERRIDGALFFSPRTARTFVRLVGDARISDACTSIVAYAISPAAARTLDALPWREVKTAEEPTENALLAFFAPAGG